MFMNHAADPGIIGWEAYGHFPNGACKTLESFVVLKEASISLVLLILVLKSDSDWMKIPYTYSTCMERLACQASWLRR